MERDELTNHHAKDCNEPYRGLPQEPSYRGPPQEQPYRLPQQERDDHIKDIELRIHDAMERDDLTSHHVKESNDPYWGRP